MLNYFRDKLHTFFSSFFTSIFKIGSHIPKSVAIIMDGNRRYAQKKHLHKIKGHEEGLSTLLNVLLWCIDLEIKELTAYAFSIDNFNRPKEEVHSLMNLAREKFSKLTDKNEYLNKNGVKVCFYGNLNFLDDEMKATFTKMEKDTMDNKKIKLNVCFPYNSTEELYRVINITKDNLLICDDCIDLREKFESNLYGEYNCNPDILIRTSGEIRLSNFMLYQCRFSILFFVDKYWPEFSLKDFLMIIIRYNIDYKSHIGKIKILEEQNKFPIKNIN